MRILHYVTNFLHLTETFIYNEIIGLDKIQEVEVLCINRLNPERFPFDDLRQLRYPQFPGKGILRLELEKRDLSLISYRNRIFSNDINQAVRDFQPDIIHCHFGYEAARFLENFTRTDIPVFISFHGNDASERLRSNVYCRRLKPLLARPNVYAIFVSKFLHSNFIKKIAAPRYFILYYGINLSQFERKKPAPPPQPFTFLQVSSFREKKGHVYTVRAFKKMLDAHPDAHCKLILAGDGPLLNEIKQLCQSLGIAHLVEFPGFVSSAQARDLMEEAHAFLHHSITAANGDTEGMPNAIMEAMAMELPVISTYHSGIPELVEDGVNGFLVQEKDVEPYADRLSAIMTWPLQPTNREKIMTICEIGGHARQLSQIYQTVNSEQ
ncbi:MAG: glycosyltransferase [Saprospiraceae bacterium]|nr:glycosyltransferase [Saprospiraceae bacterium]